MQKKFNFWGVCVTPWTRDNRLLVSLYILILICVILSVVYITTGWMSLDVMWFFLTPVGFYTINLVVGLLVDRLRKKLPPNPLLQTDCMIVNNALQTPGIAYLGDGQLILKPLVGKQITIPLGNVQQIRERKWYNGQGYWGKAIFFEFPALKQWRLGFGVANARVWRDALGNCKMEKRKLSFGAIQIVSVLLMVLSPLLLTGCMSIHEAARMGNAAEVKKQLAWGVGPNSQTFRYRNAPLHEAAAYGRIKIVKLLLKKDADVNITNEGGETPLHYAAKHGYTEIMEILLENGADPEQKGTGCGTPMQWAARNGQIQSIKTLLGYGVSIDQRGTGGRTGLMDAVSSEQLETVEFLLTNGADVNITTGLGGGCSPLYITACHDNVKIGRILLQHGADSTFECEGRKIPQSFIEKLR